MNAFEVMLAQKGFVVDALGVFGLGLVALAAVRLAAATGSRHATVMTAGAILLVAGRISALALGHLLTPGHMAEMSAVALNLIHTGPFTLLTLGLAGTVFGFWGHEKNTAKAPVRHRRG